MKMRSLLSAVVLAGLAACGGGGGSAAGSGHLRLALTDAPSCGYDAVYVTVEKVRLHQSSSAREQDGGWSELTLASPQRVNLLDLNNGVLQELGQTPLPAGSYQQLRLVLVDNQTTPLAQAVIPTGGAEVELKTPSAQQSGLKLKVKIDVAADQTADFVIDFDACKSVVKAGKSGQYLLKPVLQVIARTQTGVAGQVDASLAHGSTTLALQQNGATVRSTMPTASGSFLLQPVAPGTYTFVLTTPGRAAAVVKAVGVASGEVVRINPVATPLNPPSSPSGTLTGTVTTALTPVDATVRALTQLTGGPLVEWLARPVDGNTGGYFYQLPTAAPQVAIHAAGAAPVFSADGGAAGAYSLEALAAGETQASGPMVLGGGATVVRNFAFP